MPGPGMKRMSGIGRISDGGGRTEHSAAEKTSQKRVAFGKRVVYTEKGRSAVGCRHPAAFPGLIE